MARNTHGHQKANRILEEKQIFSDPNLVHLGVQYLEFLREWGPGAPVLVNMRSIYPHACELFDQIEKVELERQVDDEGKCIRPGTDSQQT